MAQLADMVKAGQKITVAAPMKGTSDLPLMNTILAFYGISLKDIEKAGGKNFFMRFIPTWSTFTKTIMWISSLRI